MQYLWVNLLVFNKFRGRIDGRAGALSDSSRYVSALQTTKRGHRHATEPQREPRKEQEPKPEPIDPPSDAPPVELPGDPMDEPNI